MQETIKQVLMRRDDLSSEEADDLIAEVKQKIQTIACADGSYDDVVEIIAIYLGLEPDYMDELIF
jgi:tellurite resistance protein